MVTELPDSKLLTDSSSSLRSNASIRYRDVSSRTPVKNTGLVEMLITWVIEVEFPSFVQSSFFSVQLAVEISQTDNSNFGFICPAQTLHEQFTDIALHECDNKISLCPG